MGDFDNGFGGSGTNLVILARTAGMGQPTQGPLHDPAPQQFFPFVRPDLFGNIHAPAKDLVHIEDKTSAISGIGAEFLDGRVSFAQLLLLIGEGVYGIIDQMDALCAEVEQLKDQCANSDAIQDEVVGGV